MAAATTTSTTATSSVAIPPARSADRKLSDYCGIFAEKTNRIGKNVQSFMRSRGLLPIRRSFDSTSSSNSDFMRNEQPREHTTRQNNHPLYPQRCHRNCKASSRMTHRMKRASSHPSTSYPPLRGSLSVDRSHETEPRRSRRREYVADYEDEDGWRRNVAARVPRASEPISGRYIYHCTDRRHMRYPTVEPSSRIKDETYGFHSLQTGAYPKSLEELTDTEPDNLTTCLPSFRTKECREKRLLKHRRRRDYRDLLAYDDEFLRVCRNLTRLDRYSEGVGKYSGKFEPGQVYYERECRTFGKDTVAFIYYKTCYL